MSTIAPESRAKFFRFIILPRDRCLLLAIIESGELAARRIGSSYRIKLADLDEYLSR